MKPPYRRMIKRYQEKLSDSPKEQAKEWLVYILECNDGSYYTGITKDLERRFKQHTGGRASRYTRSRRPLKLLYTETCFTRSEALIRECAVKSLPRKQKEKLVQSRNH